MYSQTLLICKIPEYMSQKLTLTGSDLDLHTVVSASDDQTQATLSADARSSMQNSVNSVRAAVADDRVCYGINTGFGAFANRIISSDQVHQLQYNLVRSHVCGIGDPLPDKLVKRILLLKANSLALGHSGIRPEVVDVLIEMFNKQVYPVIPERGSVGASGDLAPLAHLALAVIGEGEATHKGKTLEGPAVLKALGMKPVALEAKEGLALLNGTQVSAALAIEGLLQADTLLQSSIVIGALSVEGLAGSHTPFDDRIHRARNMPGQIDVATAFRSLLGDSEINQSHADCDRVQDPYSLRCMPQVFGATLNTLHHASDILSAELNGVSDNPLIFGDDVLSGGNFHAEPLAMISDFLAIAVAELGNISERRIDLMERRINPSLNMFLTAEPGLESGFMIAHVSAAALASENKTLAHPASIDSIPTSAGQEDHVSMAPWAGLKLLRIAANTAIILAIEALAAAHAIDKQRPLKTTPALESAHRVIRKQVAYDPDDHRLDRDIASMAAMIESGGMSDQLAISRFMSFSD